MTTGRVLTVVFGDVKPGARRTPVFSGICEGMRAVNELESADDVALLWRSNSASVRNAAYRRLNYAKSQMVQVYARYGITPDTMRHVKAHVTAVRQPILDQQAVDDLPDIVASEVRRMYVQYVVAKVVAGFARDLAQLPPWELEELRLRFLPKRK